MCKRTHGACLARPQPLPLPAGRCSPWRSSAAIDRDIALTEPRYHRWLDTGLLAICAVELTTGSLLYGFESAALARAVWLIRVVPVLIALRASTVLAIWHRKAGGDVLALPAIGFAW